MTSTIASETLLVSVDPRVGGTITDITHRHSGMKILGSVPWQPVGQPIASLAARDESEWLSRYTGGWPLLFPNGGDACTVNGLFHGFHGEASIAPWELIASQETIRLTRRFHTVPVELCRDIAIDVDLVIVRETLRMTGTLPVAAMWGHHPTFGSDLLAGPIEITAGHPRLSVDAAFDPPANPLIPGTDGIWPMAPGKSGMFDLGHPSAGPMVGLVYLHDFAEPWVALRRCDNAVAAVLSWSADRFPCAWLWFELNGTAESPWNGNTRLIGVEPNTTRSAYGLADAMARGTGVLCLNPGDELSATVRLQVLKPSGPITAIDSTGRAVQNRFDKSIRK